jgi:CBS-domain-containing membrane protein
VKTIRVDQVYHPSNTATDSIPEDTSMEYIIGRFAQESCLHGVFLVDSRQRLSGIITDRDLLKWARYKLFGGKGRREISAWDFFRIVEAKNVKELLAIADVRSLVVNKTDSLQTALDKMLDHDICVLPVVDEEGRILGGITLSEVMLKVIELGQQK